MLRGTAALLVLIGHARGFVFVDVSALQGGKLLAAPLYLICGLGHQAVIVFFALSGFLVGGPALRRIHQRRWKAADYAVHRFTRLWTTLLPALAATLLLDFTGRDLLGLRGYGGEYLSILASGPFGRTDLSLATIAGNAAFLQTVAVPTLGSNGPLWSLANEFWYYFLIPFAWLAIRGGVALPWRAAAGIAALAAALLLPRDLVALGAIWLAGGLAFLILEQVERLGVGMRRLALAAALVLTLAAAGFSFARPSLAADLILGLCCAGLLPCLAQSRPFGGFYGRLSFALSEISFTLYVVHFPLLALIWFGLIAPAQFAPGPASIALWLALIASAIGFATAMWWLFERNTGRVRKWAQHRLGTAT